MSDRQRASQRRDNALEVLSLLEALNNDLEAGRTSHTRVKLDLEKLRYEVTHAKSN